MKKRIVLNAMAAVTVMAAFSGSNSWAALSPFYDSIEQFNAAMNSLAEKTAYPVTSVVLKAKRGDGAEVKYTVVADKCTYTVTLKAIPSRGAGKTTYSSQSVVKEACEEPSVSSTEENRRGASEETVTDATPRVREEIARTVD